MAGWASDGRTGSGVTGAFEGPAALMEGGGSVDEFSLLRTFFQEPRSLLDLWGSSDGIEASSDVGIVFVTHCVASAFSEESFQRSHPALILPQVPKRL